MTLEDLEYVAVKNMLPVSVPLCAQAMKYNYRFSTKKCSVEDYVAETVNHVVEHYMAEQRKQQEIYFRRLIWEQKDRKELRR